MVHLGPFTKQGRAGQGRAGQGKAHWRTVLPWSRSLEAEHPHSATPKSSSFASGEETLHSFFIPDVLACWRASDFHSAIVMELSVVQGK